MPPEGDVAILCMAAFFFGCVSIASASNAELEDRLLACAALEENSRRLHCVDSIIQSLAPAAIVEAEKPPTVAPLQTETVSVDKAEDQELGQKYLHQPEQPKASTSYSLVAAYKDSKKRWNFEFKNGQVWRQLEPRYLPKIKDLPQAVEISEGILGSHDLRTARFGKPVKVKRVH